MKYGKWLRLYKYQSAGYAPQFVFAALPRSGTAALKIVVPRPPRRLIDEFDEDDNPMRSPSVSDVPPPHLFANLSVIYSQMP